MQVPYGVVDIDGNEICGLREKPVSRHFDMPELFDACRAREMRTHAYLVEEYWVDIGQIDGYRRANADFASIFWASFRVASAAFWLTARALARYP